MARILSIAYDAALLQTRDLMLKREGHEVESAIGFSAAIHACQHDTFDLVIMGHSIPWADKQAIIKQLREVCSTPILALRRVNEETLETAEYNMYSSDPKEFLNYVRDITQTKTASAS